MSALFLASAAVWVVKATVLLGLAAIVHATSCRRVSAATRHLVWVIAIVSVLALPVASVVLPAWPVVIRTAPPAAPAVVVPDVASSTPALAPSAAPVFVAPPPAAPSRANVSWPALAAGVYLAGLIGMLLQLLVQYKNARRLVLRATTVHEPEWTRLLAECAARMGVRRPVCLFRSREHAVPVAVGTASPAIVIPAIADSWEEDRRQAVLLHELAHVVRFDCLTQTLASIACALYWFHPAAWWVARRLRTERELACDDRVIAAGAEPREYAGHLLEIAYSFGSDRAPALAVGMARSRNLEARLRAALDAARDRRVPAARVRLASAAAAGLVLVLLAGAAPATEARAEAGAPGASASAPADAQHHQTVGPALKEWSFTGFVHHVLHVAMNAFGLAQGSLPGTWEVRPTGKDGVVQLRMFEFNSSSGSEVPLDRLEGLTAAQLTGAGGPVRFRIRRDAGTFSFDGVARNGVAAGTFTFAPDDNFAAELARRGFARPTSGEQYQLAWFDVGYAFLDELTAQGYAKPQTSDLVRAGQHGVHAGYLRDMGSLGYRLGSLDPLITLRDHGVTPAYVRALAELGYKGLPADDLRQARDHGVTPEYVRGVQDVGYRSLPMINLVNARDHGVTPDYVRGLGDAGHRNLTLDQAIRMRDHGVTPAYARGLRDLGFALPLDGLVQARDHGVTVEYVRAMAAFGYGTQPITSLIRMRDHGVTPEYAQELKTLGYDGVPLDDIVMLRDYGLTSDRIRAANARAGTHMSLDMLKSFARSGTR